MSRAGTPDLPTALAPAGGDQGAADAAGARKAFGVFAARQAAGSANDAAAFTAKFPATDPKTAFDPSLTRVAAVTADGLKVYAVL